MIDGKDFGRRYIGDVANSILDEIEEDEWMIKLCKTCAYQNNCDIKNGCDLIEGCGNWESQNDK